MCGICGTWGRAEPESVGRMIRAMEHRGPDDRGIYSDVRACLGMSRLSILDLSNAAHQPMHNEDKTIWIVYNGEMYNFQTERELLENSGQKFFSRSDTEVVLKLYERYGDDFLLRLRGMFALAIFDKRRGPGRERMILARDHLGIKPLIYARSGNSLVFASELKALLASGLIASTIDPVSLRLLLSYGSIYQPHTMIEGVSMLLPAHRLIVDEKGERLERYWSIEVDRLRPLRARPYEELVERVAEKLEESVRLQMVSDVPVGAFLSGGVDSSLLVGLMTRIAGRRVKTFSVGFEAEGAGLDESQEAERSALFFGADHTRVVVTGSDLKNRVEHFVEALDQPSVDGVNSYFVSMAAKQSVTVAISGTGGDELFAGYPWFAEMALYERKKAGKEGRFLNRLLGLPLLGPFFGRAGMPRHSDKEFLNRYGATYQVFGPAGAPEFMKREPNGSEGMDKDAARDLAGIDELPRAATIERVSALCLRGYTANQLLRDIDAVSMAHSLEVRVPFLDVPLTDLAFSLPFSSKLGDIDGIDTSFHTASYRETGAKKVLIDAGRKLGILPDSIDCQPKRGFTMPLDHWLKGPLKDVLFDTLSTRSVKSRGLLEPRAVEQVKDGFLEGVIHWTRPWLLVVLELWCRQTLGNSLTSDSRQVANG